MIGHFFALPTFKTWFAGNLYALNLFSSKENRLSQPSEFIDGMKTLMAARPTKQ